jgi:nucleoside-diphosphate-sugar epimerase
LKKKEIIITGGSGFIGTHLSLYLIRQGFKITTISLRKDNWQSLISDNVYAIVHLAGIKSENKKYSDDDFLRSIVILQKRCIHIILLLVLLSLYFLVR